MHIKWLKCFTWKACMEIAKLLEENKIIEVRLEIIEVRLEKLINFCRIISCCFCSTKNINEVILWNFMVEKKNKKQLIIF